MPDRDRRRVAEALSLLDQLIERMETLGRDADGAVGRITTALSGSLASGQSSLQQQQLVDAIGDVIDIVTERTKLAHEARRMITDLRRDEAERRRQSPS